MPPAPDALLVDTVNDQLETEHTLALGRVLKNTGRPVHSARVEPDQALSLGLLCLAAGHADQAAAKARPWLAAITLTGLARMLAAQVAA